MRAIDVFRAFELSAAPQFSAATVDGGEAAMPMPGTGHVTNLTKAPAGGGKKSRIKGLAGASSSIVLIMVAAVAIFMIPAPELVASGILERLITSPDTQSTDIVQSEFAVLQNGLHEGVIPQETADNLKTAGYLVGYIDGDGLFVETNQHEGGLVMKKKAEVNSKTANVLQDFGYMVARTLGFIDGESDYIADNGTTEESEYIYPDDFRERANTDVELYDAVTRSTYGRAGGYYDNAADAVFVKIGTNRNNFNADTDFDTTMESLLCDGIDINISGVGVDEENNLYAKVPVGSGSGAEEFVNNLRESITADSEGNATLDAGNVATNADSFGLEQCGAIAAAAYLENIDKMRAGDGNDSQIHAAMNSLFDQTCTKIMDIESGKEKEVCGAIVESPTMFALLTGNTANESEVRNFSSERIDDLVSSEAVSAGLIDASAVAAEGDLFGQSLSKETAMSTSTEKEASIGRETTGEEQGNEEILKKIQPYIDNSIINNGYKSLKGVVMGEAIAHGVFKIQSDLANQSGGTLGDAAAVEAYMEMNDRMIALDAKAERLHKSPFDITSKNTFLGSIVYNFAIAMVKNEGLRNFASGIATFGEMLSNSIVNILPKTSADTIINYRTDYGNCPTLSGIGAVGPKNCAQVRVFDQNTYGIFDEGSEGREFLDTYTKVDSNGQRVVNEDVENNPLVVFIDYCYMRETRPGVPDAALLEKIQEQRQEQVEKVLGVFANFPFLKDITMMVSLVSGASEEELNMANYTNCVISDDNVSWKWNKKDTELATTQTAVWVNDSDNSGGGESGGESESEDEEDSDTKSPFSLNVSGFNWAQRVLSVMRAYKIMTQNPSSSAAYHNMKYFEGDTDMVTAYLEKHYPDAPIIAVNK